VIILAAISILANVKAQEKIFVKDAREINVKASDAVHTLAGLLNFVSTPGITKSELTAAIDSSYLPSTDKLFYDDKAIFESDVDPAADLGKTIDMPVDKYLNDLDIKYVKAMGSIKLTIDYVSGIKFKDFLFVRVRFSSRFDSKYKINNSTYSIRQREAVIRLERGSGKNWNAFIVGVNFYNPANPIESSENNVPVTMETQTIPQDSLAVILKRDSIVRADSVKRIETKSLNYVKSADSLIKNNQFAPALEILEKAKDLVRFSPQLTIKINYVKGEIAKNTYKNYKNKGDDAKSKHKYTEAIQSYRRANNLRGEADASLQPDIDYLTKMLTTIDYPKNILQTGVPDDAIKECERVLGLKENKFSKNDFPELYYIEAMAYEKLLENKQNDVRLADKAAENFNAAIAAFPNYTDAHIARADFLVKYKHDFIAAITDYDALINSVLDDAPETPGYYAKRAKYKDMAVNYTGAIDDYTRSIALSPKADSFYFARGELLYQLNKTDGAQRDLDSAIILNDKNKQAFYYRGLNYVKTKNNYKAGLDFAAAEKLGIEPAQSVVIDSISYKYFFAGQDLASKHDFTAADSAFNDALKIRNCNALALHGKAGIRLTTAGELKEKNNLTDAAASYRESITLNTQAIACKPDFSDAYFKNGLAHASINENDLAISSFSEAIRVDNSNVQAFIERGNTLQLQQKYTKAGEDYTGALTLLKIGYDDAKKGNNAIALKEIIADQAKVHVLYGQTLYYTFDYPNSLITLNQALDLDEKNSDALYYRGRIYFDKNEISRSIDDFNAALKIKPDYRYYYSNGIANHKLKNYAPAIAAFTGVIQLDTLNIIKNKYYLRGLSYFKSKSYTVALTDFNEYNKSESAKTDTAFYADYGRAQLFANQDSLAVNSFNQAISLSANNGKALYGLGCYNAKIGRFNGALELFEKAFATHLLTKEDIKPEEEAFFVEFNKDRANRSAYSKLKKTYLNN